VALDTVSTTFLMPVAVVTFSTASPKPFMTTKLILSLSSAGTRLLTSSLASPQLLASPIPRRQLVVGRITFVACLETLTRRRTVVVTVTLCTKMNNLLLAIGTSLDHLLLALARR